MSFYIDKLVQQLILLSTTNSIN